MSEVVAFSVSSGTSSDKESPMIRMYLLMAALCQLMACSTVPTEAKVPELGSEVDSASCEG
ncbi:hypothetical protein HOI18_03910, partial [Candidatus Uhrbacteria bacterium]|nr:hypothetical protein [Candidatus Uhrbacteria bacterium]